MNKKYIPFAILIILIVVAGVYIHMRGLSEEVPQTEGSEVLGIKDDLKISNQIVSFVEEGNDQIKITYKYVITHAGNYTAKNIVARNWFTNTPENTFEVLSITSNSHLNINQAFDGKNDTNIIAGDNIMPANSSAEILVSIGLTYRERSLQFISYVDVSGKSENEEATGASGGASTVTTTQTSTSTGPSTSKPSSTSSSKPSSSSSKTSSSSAPVVIDYNFNGLRASAGGGLSSNITIGHNHGVRLFWNGVGANCVRSAEPPNSQWTGDNGAAQGVKDIMHIKQQTTFKLNCNGATYGVVVNVNPPKTSTSSSATTPTVPASSGAASDPITDPIDQASNMGNVGGAEALGLYDAAQVTFSLPRRGEVAGAVTMESSGKGQQ